MRQFKRFRRAGIAFSCIALGAVFACGGEGVPATDVDAPARVATSKALARKFADPAVQAVIRQDTSEAAPEVQPEGRIDVTETTRQVELDARPVATATAYSGFSVSTTPDAETSSATTPETPDVAAPIGCSDFYEWPDAQTFFYDEGGPLRDDYHLDTNRDGIACNTETDQGTDGQIFKAPTIEDILPESERGSIVAEDPLVEFSPAEVAAIGWQDFEREGYLFLWKQEGDTIRVLQGATEWVEVSCGPHIGSSPDSRISPTWTNFSHFVWLWYEGNGEQGCVGVSKWVDWAEKKPGACELHFEPLSSEQVAYGESVELAEGEVAVECSEQNMQYGVWTPERGIIGISDADMATVLGGGIEGRDEQLALDARREGWYLIYLNGYPPHGSPVCMRTPLTRGLDVMPCLRCQAGLLR